jgi:hypothetical protein
VVGYDYEHSREVVMAFRRLVPFLTGLALGAGPCPTEVPSGADPVEVRRISQVYNSGIGQSRRIVIRDAGRWASFWAELQGSVTPQPPLPPVDFDRDVVIAAAMGTRNSGGYAIEIRQVAEENGSLIALARLVALVVETAPGDRCYVTAALTQPVDVVLVPGMAGREVSFVAREEVHNCG